MNLAETVELLSFLSEIPIRDSAKYPEIHILHNVGEGYTLHITAESLNPEFRSQLTEIIEACKLRIRESNHYLIIYNTH